MSVRILCVRLILIYLVLHGMSATAKAEPTVDVRAGKLLLHVPTTWKKELPSSRMRLLQFRVAAGEGDEQNTEFVVFSFRGGGTVKQNIERWIGQFAPQGRRVALFQGKTKEGEYWLADISGVYKKPIGPPIAGRTKEIPDSRVLKVILMDREGGVYYLTLVGPNKTVAAQGQRFRAVFDANTAEEKPFSLDQ